MFAKEEKIISINEEKKVKKHRWMKKLNFVNYKKGKIIEKKRENKLKEKKKIQK